jgi:hypothetical protein
MSISLNSNEEISFDVTPVSSIAGRSNIFNNKSKLYEKKGAVPNTKLVYEDSRSNISNSPMTIRDPFKEIPSKTTKSQQDPAISEAPAFSVQDNAYGCQRSSGFRNPDFRQH